MEKDWIVRALAMHAAIITTHDRLYKVDGIPSSDAFDHVEVAEDYAKAITAFAQGALDKPVDPFS